MTGSIEDFKNSYLTGLTDYTDNGKCTGCGECCGRILPLNDTEIKQIKRYVRRNNIKPCTHNAPYAKLLFDMTCPFMDNHKSNDKCSIYNVRPAVCKAFKCDSNTYDPDAEYTLLHQSNTIIDMWEEFFPGMKESVFDMITKQK